MREKIARRPMGRSMLAASTIGLGTWAMGGWMWGGHDDANSIAAIRTALDEGVTLIDTAPAYGLGKAEELVGEAIAGRRHDVILATKCGLPWHTDKGTHFFDEHGRKVYRYLGRDSIFQEVEHSLKRLKCSKSFESSQSISSRSAAARASRRRRKQRGPSRNPAAALRRIRTGGTRGWRP